MRPRPLYQSHTPLPLDEVRQRIAAALEAGAGPCEGHVGKRTLELHIHEPARHMWSPHISIELTEGDNGTFLKGYFGPHPHLWGIFTAMYAAQFFLWIAAVMYSMVAWNLGLDLSSAYIVAGLSVSLTLSCVTNIAGEWAGAPQMKLTERFLAEALVP